MRPRVFGSVLTGTDTEDSDLDLLVDPRDSTTLMTIAGLPIDAEELLGVSVDVLNAGSPQFSLARFQSGDGVVEVHGGTITRASQFSERKRRGGGQLPRPSAQTPAHSSFPLTEGCPPLPL